MFIMFAFCFAGETFIEFAMVLEFPIFGTKVPCFWVMMGA